MAPTVSPIKQSPSGSRAYSAKRAERKSAVRRTTVALSHEALEIVERFKSACGVSTSAAIDQIIQRSDPKPSRLKNLDGFLVLDLPGDRKTIHCTLDDIKRIEDEMDREYMERSMSRRMNSVSNGISTGNRQ